MFQELVLKEKKRVLPLTSLGLPGMRPLFLCFLAVFGSRLALPHQHANASFHGACKEDCTYPQAPERAASVRPLPESCWFCSLFSNWLIAEVPKGFLVAPAAMEALFLTDLHQGFLLAEQPRGRSPPY